MKSCIVQKYYQSERDKEINQTVFLKKFHGGERVTGEWTYDKKQAYVFDRKSHAKSICKGMKLDGLSLIELHNS